MKRSEDIHGRVLGFDFGLKRIGVAIGQTQTDTAAPEAIVTSKDGRPDWDHITKLFDTWQPAAIVVGLPLRMDGSEQPLTQSARKFGQRLSGRYGHLPLFFMEEQLSSKEAERRMKTTQTPLDDHAAQIILESWLRERAQRIQHA